MSVREITLEWVAKAEEDAKLAIALMRRYRSALREFLGL